MFKSHQSFRKRIIGVLQIIVIITVLIWGLPITPSGAIQGKTKKPTKGTDENGIQWTYNKKTKTLTFQGKGDMEEIILDGHGPVPDWYCWDEEAEHIVVKRELRILQVMHF